MSSSVIGALVRRHSFELTVTALLRLANTLVQCAPPLLVQRLLKLLEARAAVTAMEAAAASASGAAAASGGRAAATAVSASSAAAAASLVVAEHWSSLRVAGLLAVALSVKSVIESQFFFLTSNMGLKIKVALRGAVYQKSLKLSPSARQALTAGEV
jgi:hypothetical protein